MHSSRGFTLIELLVVIAIIAILAAILFPVFLRAKDNARRANCTMNFKGIFSALTMYCDDNNGYMPRVHDISGNWTAQDEGFGALHKYSKGNIFRCANATPKTYEVTYKLYYPVYRPNGPCWTASYHFWPHLYTSQPYSLSSPQINPNGRLDANVGDRKLVMWSFNAKSSTRCAQLGGPLVDNFLHNYGNTGVNEKGVLMLNLKGTVRFLQADAYPLY